MEFYADLRDIKFVLFEQVGIDRVLELPEHEGLDRDTAAAIVDEAYRFARERVAPLNADSDRQGARFDPATRQVTMPDGFREVYEQYCENGWLSLSHNAELGGQGMPYVLHLASDELFMGACLSFCENSLLTHGAAHLIEVFGSEQLRQTYVPNMYTGRWAGTMCLTEAGAGTDVGACTTKAIPEGDHYLIEGEKVFITGGEHDLTENICHAVLARIEGAPAGTRGLSLFLVPKIHLTPDGALGEPNDVACTGIEHKLGIHGSPTCTLMFGERGQCRGYLLGEENRGMAAMFQMMNEARISVGLQGAALGNAAYQQALHYAAERAQSRHYDRAKQGAAKSTPIIHHPDVRRMLLWQKAWCEGARALLLRTGAFVDLAHGAPDPADRERYAALVEVLTPICKAYSTDLGFQSASLSLQTLGGYGYVTEYPVEQYLRDVRIASIYEGTNGVQAMDLVGRKLPAKGGDHVRQLLGLVGELATTHQAHPALAAEMALLSASCEAVADASAYLGELGREDPGLLLLAATPYLELFGQLLLSWLLLEQATLAYPKLGELCAERGVSIDEPAAVAELCEAHDEARFYAGKLTVARFYAQRVLRLSRAQADALQSGDRSALEGVL